MNLAIENRFYDLLGRKLAGECQPAELEELESILHSHPELQSFYNQILTHSSEVSEASIEAAYAAHRAKMMYTAGERGKTVTRTLVRTLVAASVILILGLTWLLLKK